MDTSNNKSPDKKRQLDLMLSDTRKYNNECKEKSIKEAESIRPQKFLEDDPLIQAKIEDFDSMPNDTANSSHFKYISNFFSNNDVTDENINVFLKTVSGWLYTKSTTKNKSPKKTPLFDKLSLTKEYIDLYSKNNQILDMILYYDGEYKHNDKDNATLRSYFYDNEFREHFISVFRNALAIVYVYQYLTRPSTATQKKHFVPIYPINSIDYTFKSEDDYEDEKEKNFPEILPDFLDEFINDLSSVQQNGTNDNNSDLRKIYFPLYTPCYTSITLGVIGSEIMNSINIKNLRIHKNEDKKNKTFYCVFISEKVHKYDQSSKKYILDEKIDCYEKYDYKVIKDDFDNLVQASKKRTTENLTLLFDDEELRSGASFALSKMISDIDDKYNEAFINYLNIDASEYSIEEYLH